MLTWFALYKPDTVKLFLSEYIVIKTFTNSILGLRPTTWQISEKLSKNLSLRGSLARLLDKGIGTNERGLTVTSKPTFSSPKD